MRSNFRRHRRIVAALVRLLRRFRTAAYWLATPMDRVRRLGGSGNGGPPLWLRRHAGPVAFFQTSARDTAQLIERLQLLREGDRVLDVGCGPGAMIPSIAARLGPTGRYVGFDVHRPSIRWCRRRYAADPRLSFAVAPISSEGCRFGPPGAAFRFPVGDGDADFVLVKSVFTHLLESDARHYLLEIRRVLRPGRGALVTALLFDGGAAHDGIRSSFPFADGKALVRLRSRIRPTAAVAYEKSFFFRMIQDAGLRVQWMWAGFFPGGAEITGQDTLLLGH